MVFGTRVSSPLTMMTSLTVMHCDPSARAVWAITVEEPDTPGRFSLCQLELAPTPPRNASWVAAAA